MHELKSLSLRFHL